ncbi:hypothetical protein GT50_11365 [Geobacillus stearothermophilus 10]|nr:hypothetical protein GT50_11365 [Geobacillus stearothermophilus 10]
MDEDFHLTCGEEREDVVRSYGLDVGGALLVLLFSFLFPTFNVGYYAYGSFLRFAIGSLIVGLARIRWNPHARLGGVLVGSFLIIAVSVIIILLFPIEIRDVGDVVMPYVNAIVNALIYFMITNALHLLHRLTQGNDSFWKKR